MEFGKRIQKLESDIQLISCIRDILMSSNYNSSLLDSNGDGRFINGQLLQQEFPERDPGGGGDKKKECQTSKINNNNASSDKKPSKTKCLEKSKSNIDKTVSENDNITAQQNKQQECIEKLQEEVATEIRNRLDAEESAKIVAIRLQKVDDDLQREKEIKKSLLEGTLQMKNQLQSYHSEISVLGKRIADMQTENDKLVNNLKSLEEDKVQEVVQYQNQIQVLHVEKAKLINRHCKLENELEALKTRNSELKSKFQKTQEELTKQDNQLKTQLQESVEKVALLDDQKRKIEQQLQSAQNRIEILQEKLKSSHFKIKNQQQDYSLKLKEKEEKIQSLNSTLKQERVNLSQKIDAATALVSRTKSFIIGLQNDKQIKENQVQKYLLDIRQLHQEKEECAKMVQELKKNANHQDNFRERFWSLSQESQEKIRGLEQEREKLKQQLKYDEEEILNLSKSQELLRQELANAVKKSEEEKIAGDSTAQCLREELKRVSDNLQILQKISEDQGKTISKQRNDLETNSESRNKLELQLRESSETEKALVVRLREEESSNRELERQISHFQQQISLLNKEVKEHDCEEFVESKFLGKVKELERKASGLEGKIKTKEEECTKAMAAARKAVTQATQLKDSFEQKILKIKSSNSNEILKIRQENQQQEAERNKKISDLESEILRMRESCRQMQNAYLAKIQQLQNALTACCVGVGVGGAGNNGTQQGFNLGFPQQPAPHCAANFNVGGIQGVPFPFF